MIDSKYKGKFGKEVETLPEKTLTAISNLKSETVNFEGKAIEVLGYYAKGDGGGGLFYWDDSSTEVDNGGTIIQATSIVNGRWKRVFSGAVNVKWFGAKGDGITDNYKIILDALNYVIEDSRKQTLFFPSGTYNINSSGLFSSFVGNNKIGLSVEGDGRFSTVLKLVTGGVEKWFYDNPVDSRKMQFPVFSNMRFTSDNRNFGSGFKIWSNGHEQGYKFINCEIDNLYDVLYIYGPFNGSENRFINCRIMYITKSVLTLNNPQAVNHELVNCEVEGMYGDIINIGSGGGGSVKLIGGSYILRDVPEDHAIFNITGSNNIGRGNGDMLMIGVKTELRGITSKLIKCTGSYGLVWFSIKDSNMSTLENGASIGRNLIELGMNKKVLMDNVMVHDLHRFKFYSTTSGYALASPGHINISNSMLSTSISEKVDYDATKYGILSIRGCRNTSNMVNGDRITYAIDMDYNWQNAGRADIMPLKKLMVIKPANYKFPLSETTDWSAVLPANSILTSIKIYKPGGTSATALYQLHVGNGDKTVKYDSSELGANGIVHKINTADLFIEVGENINERTVKLWADPVGGSFFIGGYAILEYI